MKIRLIEPDAPSMHLWSHSYFVRLGLPMIGATLKQHGHDVRIYNPQLAPIDWDDVHTAELVGPLQHDVDHAGHVRHRRRSAAAAHPRGHRRLARHLHGRRGAGACRLRGPRRGRRDDHARARRGPRGASASSSRSPAFRSAATGAAVHNELHERCADLDTLPFPDLTLIAGHERLVHTPIMTSWGCPFACNFCSVTAMFGRKYRFRSAENVVAEIKEKKPKQDLLLRRQLRRRQEAPQDAPAADDRRGPRDALGRPGAHRRGARQGAARAHAGARGPTSSPSASSRSTRPPSTASRSRRPSADIEHAIKVLHDYGIRSHGMFVLGADSDTPSSVRDTVDLRPQEPHRHRDAQHPHAAPRHAAVQRSRRRRAASSRRTGTCTTLSTWCSSPSR